MHVIPVIGDFNDFSRALQKAGIRIVLVPFADYPHDFSSLESLNQTIRRNIDARNQKDQASALSGGTDQGSH